MAAHTDLTIQMPRMGGATPIHLAVVRWTCRSPTVRNLFNLAFKPDLELLRPRIDHWSACVQHKVYVLSCYNERWVIQTQEQREQESAIPGCHLLTERIEIHGDLTLDLPGIKTAMFLFAEFLDMLEKLTALQGDPRASLNFHTLVRQGETQIALPDASLYIFARTANRHVVLQRQEDFENRNHSGLYLERASDLSSIRATWTESERVIRGVHGAARRIADDDDGIEMDPLPDIDESDPSMIATSQLYTAFLRLMQSIELR